MLLVGGLRNEDSPRIFLRLNERGKAGCPPSLRITASTELSDLFAAGLVRTRGAVQRDRVGRLRSGLPWRLLRLLGFGCGRLCGFAGLGGVCTADWVHHDLHIGVAQENFSLTAVFLRKSNISKMPILEGTRVEK